MGRPFIPGQNYPEIGQRVLTLGPWPVTLPTGSPSPATLPLRPTTTTMTTTTIRTTRPRTTRRRTTTATCKII
uniref:Candidate secreted effector n=1 Tax=Meloidogyne incognita TaxID=6306 RepID=A0A914L3D0_MELIC